MKRDTATIDMFDDWLAEQPAPVAAPAPVADLKNKGSVERASAPVERLHKIEETMAAPVGPLRKIAPGDRSDMVTASESGPSEPIDFITRRTKLGRWILHPGRSIEAYERGILRELGEIPPAPILPFAPRPPPADPGDDDAPVLRAG